jgi:ABC-type sugar transport system substrate-binding protein
MKHFKQRKSFFRVAFAVLFTVITVLPCALQSANAQETDRFRGVVQPVVAKKSYRIGFSAVHFVDKFWLGMVYGMADEAKRSNVVLVSVLSAGGYGNLSQQISNLETLSGENLDGIIVAGATYDGLDRTIKHIVDSGVKVIVAGTPVNSKDASLGILEDESLIGKQMGEYICSKKPSGQVLTLPGPQGSEWNKIRFDGFEAAIKQCGIQTVGNTFQGQMSLEDGQRQATDLLIKYPHVSYVWAVAGLLGDGAAAAIKSLGRKDVKVVTSAFTDLTVPMMKEGYIAASISEPSVLTGRLAMQYMIRLLNGDSLPNTTKGSLNYPVVVVPTKPIEAKDIVKYDLTRYDWAPDSWKNPYSQ